MGGNTFTILSTTRILSLHKKPPQIKYWHSIKKITVGVVCPKGADFSHVAIRLLHQTGERSVH